MGSPSWEDVVAVSHLGGYRLGLKFADGAEGAVDISELIRFEGVFAPLRDLEVFAQVKVDPDSGTIVWSNGADLAPESLYAAAVGNRPPVPSMNP